MPCHLGCCELSSFSCLLQFPDAKDVHEALRLEAWLVLDIGCCSHYNSSSPKWPLVLIACTPVNQVQFNSFGHHPELSPLGLYPGASIGRIDYSTMKKSMLCWPTVFQI